MTARTKSLAAEEVAAIEELVSDLEKRLRRLSDTAKRKGSAPPTTSVSSSMTPWIASWAA
jgi:hypothetical protein